VPTFSPLSLQKVTTIVLLERALVPNCRKPVKAERFLLLQKCLGMIDLCREEELSRGLLVPLRCRHAARVALPRKLIWVNLVSVRVVTVSLMLNFQALVGRPSTLLALYAACWA